MVPEPLSTRLRGFAKKEDELTLADLKKKSTGKLSPKWQSGYSAGTLASSAMFCLARYEQTGQSEFRDWVVRIADEYLHARPEEDVDVWPMSFGHVISTEVAAFQFTKRPVYLEEAQRFAHLAVNIYWQDNPLPRASMQTGHYETITGGDSLALALLETHAASVGLTNKVPSNTIDR
jgi:rhamnogalacturonyl hydrolase YesR